MPEYAKARYMNARISHLIAWRHCRGYTIRPTGFPWHSLCDHRRQMRSGGAIVQAREPTAKRSALNGKNKATRTAVVAG